MGSLLGNIPQPEAEFGGGIRGELHQRELSKGQDLLRGADNS